MKITSFNNFGIICFNKENYEHAKAFAEFVNGESKSNMISLVGERLMGSHKTDNLDFCNAYLITHYENIIGYLYLSAKKNNYIYLEMSLLKQYRKKHYGSELLNEITNIIFDNNEDLKEIRLSIDKSNIGSMKSAINAGYYYEEDDFMKEKIDFIKSNPYYINRKR